MKIESITTSHGQTVDLSEFTVLVGPNNAGKSQTLRDIQSVMAENDPRTTIVEENHYSPQSYSEFVEGLTIEPHPDYANQTTFRGINSTLQRTSSQNLQDHQVENLQSSENIFTQNAVEGRLTQFKVALLDASSRLQIANSTGTYNLAEEYPSNVMQKLYMEPSSRNRLREAFKSIFEKDVILDYSSLQQFILRIEDNFGDVEDDLFGPPEDFSHHDSIEDQGAGYRSLAGVIMSLLSSENRVVLLDEPEAFLHPAQAREFGNWLSNHVEHIPGQVIIATHNSHFLSGVLTTEPDITIHRLNRVGDHTKYNIMSSDTTSVLAEDPLLSTQQVIEGIFHEGVIVCEADSDALIYRFAASNELDNRSLLFTHAHNRQTIDRITSVLTEASIPRVAIADIDLIREPGEVSDLLGSLSSDRTNFSSVTDDCNQVNIAIRGSSVDWDDIKELGRDEFPDEVEEEVNRVFEEARSYGLFIVPTGELESWVDIDTTKGRHWVIDALDHMSENECPDELGDFVRAISEYLSEQYRELVEA